MINLWMFIAAELHLFHKYSNCKEIYQVGCKIWQGGVKYGKGCKIWQLNLPYITPPYIFCGV